MIFTDTSAFFALADRSDQFHTKAKDLLARCLSEREQLATHNYVIVETLALIHSRLGFGTVGHLLNEIGDVWRVLWVSQHLHERATMMYLRQRGKRLSFVDCVSFTVMESEGIRRYFAFDTDFDRPDFDPA